VPIVAAVRRPWAFVMPLIALGVGRAVGVEVTPSWMVLVVAITGLTCGASWQLLYRRDLVDRLTYFAAFFVVSIALVAVIPGASVTTAPAGLAISLSGVLAGLVYTEQWLRGRDERAGRTAVPEPATPERSL